MHHTQTLLKLPLPGERAVDWVSRCLSSAGLSVMCSFDLNSARSTSTPACPCPYHGTAACNCQLVVLLVYARKNTPPVTLLVHGHDDVSWLETPGCTEDEQEGLLGQIVQTLVEATV